MASQTELTHERLVQLLEFCPVRGCLLWRKSGEVAGTLTDSGYCRIKVDGRSFQAHRLIIFWCYGDWPEGVVDHIDRSRHHNRLRNLRPGSVADNNKNRSAPRKGRLAELYRT